MRDDTFTYIHMGLLAGNSATISLGELTPQSSVGIKIPVMAKLIAPHEEEEKKSSNGLHEYEVSALVN